MLSPDAVYLLGQGPVSIIQSMGGPVLSNMDVITSSCQRLCSYPPPLPYWLSVARAHPQVAPLSIIRTTSPCRADITALMKFVTADKSLAFTEPQQQRLVEAASIRLSSTVVDAGTSPIHFGMHGPSKAQTHLCSFNYYNDDDWVFFWWT